MNANVAHGVGYESSPSITHPAWQGRQLSSGVGLLTADQSD